VGTENLKVLVTGSKGFIGKNLCLHLKEDEDVEILTFDRDDSEEMLRELLRSSDVVIHLAGENRPLSSTAFEEGNAGLTRRLCEIIRQCQSQATILLASSIQATLDNSYGRSKFASEQAAIQLHEKNGNTVSIWRFPGVFGKWCRPNYNSVVATFCHNIANDLPIEISDAGRKIPLIYIDDVVRSFIQFIKTPSPSITYPCVTPEYVVSLGEIAEQLLSFKDSRSSLLIGNVGSGLTGALYSTYISYLPKHKFSYDVPMHTDDRGTFVEFFKHNDSGQFSFLTASPGVTRGSHYHHSKTEKFMVIRGTARFGFRNMITNETYDLETSGEKSTIVETIPGWAHDITNISAEELVVMVWSNNIYNRSAPDTVACAV
jgi:UDP-2-acetamido-2,6-beta-L-arabino-hexul-4-ose reductase